MKKKSQRPSNLRLVTSFARQLPVDLTDAELLDCANRLSWAMHETAQERIAQAGLKAEMKARLETMEGKEESLGQIVREKKENRSVLCYLVHDDEAHEVLTVRADSGDIVEHRAQYPDERQVTIDPDAEDAFLKVPEVVLDGIIQHQLKASQTAPHDDEPEE